MKTKAVFLIGLLGVVGIISICILLKSSPPVSVIEEVEVVEHKSNPSSEESVSNETSEEITEDHNENNNLITENLDEIVKNTDEAMEENPYVFGIFQLDQTLMEDMTGKSYVENKTISLEDLRLVKVIYYGFDHEEHQGELVVHNAIAMDIMSIFRELHKVEYPFDKIQRVDAYDGDDNLSMIDNNTSAFNYRVVAGTQKLSNHSYGLAIDINPLMNPYVTSKGIFPIEGSVYSDRSQNVDGMIKKSDPCYEAFIKRGFSWGGEWKNSKDYQHFDITIKGINE